jgi:hypothetical protein
MMKKYTHTSRLFHDRTRGEIMMEEYRKGMEEGKVPEKGILDFFNSAFQKILDNENPKKALELERSRGRNSFISALERAQRMDIALLVDHYRKKGMTYWEATEEVAEEKYMSDTTVKRRYGKYIEPAKQALQRFHDQLQAMEAQEKIVEQGRQAFVKYGKLKHIFTCSDKGEIVYTETAGKAPWPAVFDEIKKALQVKSAKFSANK